MTVRLGRYRSTVRRKVALNVGADRVRYQGGQRSDPG